MHSPIIGYNQEINVALINSYQYKLKYLKHASQLGTIFRIVVITKSYFTHHYYKDYSHRISCHQDNLNMMNLQSCKEIVLPSFHYQMNTVTILSCYKHVTHDGP